MNTIENTTAQPRLIAVNTLEKSPLNARRTAAKVGMDELKASILSHGLLQNLVVTEAGDGVFLVIAGGRRLEAIHLLQGEGNLPGDFAVPCQVVTEEHALEMSLAENTVRLAMHPDVLFKLPRVNAANGKEATASGDAFTAIAKSLPVDWLKPQTEAARFEAFRSLPDTVKLELLAYCVALTLKPKLAPADGDEATGYDAALALTEASVASYWRPAKDNFLGRISRDQLLTLARDTLGDEWAQLRATDKKALLVTQLDRAFADPAKYGQTEEQVDQLKSWLPAGMAFGTVPTPKPAKATIARKAA